MSRPSDTLPCATLAAARTAAFQAVATGDLRTLQRLATPGVSSWVGFATATEWWDAATGRNPTRATLIHLTEKGALRGGIEPGSLEKGLRCMAGRGRLEALRWALARPFVANALTADMWSSTLWASLHGSDPAAALAALTSTVPARIKKTERASALARALVGAARKSNAPAVTALLAHGVPVDAAFEGHTALQAAVAHSRFWWEDARSGAWRTVKALLDAGASLDCKSTDGLSALDLGGRVLDGQRRERIHEEALRFWGPRVLSDALTATLPEPAVPFLRPRL